MVIQNSSCNSIGLGKRIETGSALSPSNIKETRFCITYVLNNIANHRAWLLVNKSVLLPKTAIEHQVFQRSWINAKETGKADFILDKIKSEITSLKWKDCDYLISGSTANYTSEIADRI